MMINFLILPIAHAQVSIPDNLVASTTQVANGQFANLAPYLELILGVLLAVLIVEVVIEALRGKK